MSTWYLIAVAAVLGALLLWGLVAPRSQWRVLVGWSTSDPDAAEPGNGVQGIRRVICAIGLAGVLVVIGVQGWRVLDARPSPVAAPTAVEEMWGSPTPRLVDRLIAPRSTVPDGLVEGRIGGVELLTKGSPPAYLVGLPRFDLLGEGQPAGLIGRVPPKGFSGYGQADVLIESEGPLDCIPHAVTARATDETYAFAVYWGPPTGTDGPPVACDMADPILQKVLIPVQLADPVQAQTLVSDSGLAIPIVQLRK